MLATAVELDITDMTRRSSWTKRSCVLDGAVEAVRDGPATVVLFSGYVHVWPRVEHKEHGLLRSHRDMYKVQCHMLYEGCGRGLTFDACTDCTTAGACPFANWGWEAAATELWCHFSVRTERNP